MRLQRRRREGAHVDYTACVDNRRCCAHTRYLIPRPFVLGIHWIPLWVLSKSLLFHEH